MGRSLLFLRIGVWLGALTPLGWIVYRTLTGNLGVNPIETLLHWSGASALTLLMVTLAVTPLRRLTGWNRLIQVRRPLGLFAFFYACLHLTVFFVFELTGNPLRFIEEVAERPYITVGTAAWVILLLLAVTSTKGWIRRLGKRWQKLHRWVYVAAGLGVLHFLWLVKADLREPLRYLAVFAVLMGVRVFWKIRSSKGAPNRGAPKPEAANPAG